MKNKKLKIASFNANSIRVRLGIVTDWLKKESPDLLCIQELKAQDKDFPLSAFTDMGYEAVFCGEKSYNGVAILSKTPLKNVQKGFDDGTESTRLIIADFGNVVVVNTYIPQGTHPTSEKFQYKLKWFKRLYDFFDKNYSAKKQLLWIGDFNVAPEPKDVHDPKRLYGQVGFHPDEHKALQKIKDWGFVDVFRKHVPEEGQFSFWDYRAKDPVKRKVGWRVDHIWATPPLAKKSTKSWIDVKPRLLERPSDHTFIVAEFKL